MCQQRNTTFGPWCTQLFAHIIRLHSNELNKPKLSRDNYVKPRVINGTTTLGTTTEKCDNNGKGWYFRFYDDNRMNEDIYILWLTWTWMGQFNTYNPIHCYENKEGNREN